MENILYYKIHIYEYMLMFASLLRFKGAALDASKKMSYFELISLLSSKIIWELIC